VTRSALAVLVAAFALAHAPFVVSTLEDIDSVNFALGIRDFDVAEHRPHPPGYPVYIAIAKAAAAVTRLIWPQASDSSIEAFALSSLSLIGAIITVVLLYRLSAVLVAADDGDEGVPWAQPQPWALAITALAVACPLFWYLAVRPMSDVPGLAAAIAAQLCLALAWRWQRAGDGDRRPTAARTVVSGRMLAWGALLAGLAIGFRAQNAVLTLPLLAGVMLDRVGRGFGPAAVAAAFAFAVGVLVWAIPLVWTNGGIDAYLAALGSQAGEDFAGVQMLYLNPTSIRLTALALLRTLVYPWDSIPLAVVVLGLATAGLVALAWRDRRTLILLTLMALPYFAFHLLFHDTGFVRYALPLVPAIAVLAVRGAEFVARRAALPLVGAAALWAVSIGAPVVAAYGSTASPVARAVDAMRAEAATHAPGALAYHQTFRRPLQAESLDFAPQLNAPPRREWLELTRYWREGHVAPLWFLADPQRTDLALVDPLSRVDRRDFDWPFRSLSNLGGMRPSAAQWYRMPAPGWFAEEGWALTPETAGIARLMGRGPSQGPITAWVRRRDTPVRVLVGGRHLGGASDPSVTFAMRIDEHEVARWQSAPGFFLHVFDVTADALRGVGLAPLTIRADTGEALPTAIEQFDLQSPDTLMWGYDDGWHEAEYTPELGVWRWTSDRATLRIAGGTGPLQVTLRVDRPRKYFDDDPLVRLLAGDQVLAQTTFARTDVWTVTVPAEAVARSGGRLTLETNRTFVPAERREAADRRPLGLRVFSVEIAAQH
jgi:hypothetical protein